MVPAAAGVEWLPRGCILAVTMSWRGVHQRTNTHGANLLSAGRCVDAEPAAPGSRLDRPEMKRRGVKAETESGEPAPAASGAAAPSPDDVPLPKRMRTQSQKLSELDDLDLGPVPAVEAATVQAEAPSDGAQPTLDTAPRGTEGTETERMGSGELSSKSDHREGALEMPPPAPPAARRMPSLPRLGLHINIPQSNPGTPSE